RAPSSCAIPPTRSRPDSRSGSAGAADATGPAPRRMSMSGCDGLQTGAADSVAPPPWIGSREGTWMSQYTGVGVSPGRVIGTIYSMAPPVAEPPAGDTIPEGADPATEAARIPAAAATVQATLSRLAERAPGEGKKILEATAQMAADPSLSQTAQGLVTSGGKSPERAVWEAGDQVAAMLEGLGG